MRLEMESIIFRYYIFLESCKSEVRTLLYSTGDKIRGAKIQNNSLIPGTVKTPQSLANVVFQLRNEMREGRGGEVSPYLA